jgi:legumain
MLRAAFFFSALHVGCSAPDDHWAVIIAGSKGFANYRHQTDACHAYQIVKKNGIPESNIILLMQDDVANAVGNPFPGQLFNQPTKSGEAGVDVYAGCNADYTGDIVTAKLFTAVITGDSAAVANITAGYTAGKSSNKVLRSTSTSKVFLNFADHGGVGLIAMPNGPFLYAKDLQAALATMKTKSLYKELVFYVEACESGSMFEKFPTDNNVYVTTAANAKESSWGTYCPPDDVVNGKHMKTCLGDLYSVNWMEDSDKQLTAMRDERRHHRRLGTPSDTKAAESLQSQFELVKRLTNKSHVQEFGDMSFSTASIGEFQGVSAASAAFADHVNTDAVTDAETAAVRLRSAVPVPDIPLHLAYHAYIGANDAEESIAAAQRLRDELDERESSTRIMRDVVSRVVGASRSAHDVLQHGASDIGAVVADKTCQKTAMEAYAQYCREWSDYSQPTYSRAVVAMCEATRLDSTPIVNAFASVCKSEM